MAVCWLGHARRRRQASESGRERKSASGRKRHQRSGGWWTTLSPVDALDPKALLASAAAHADRQDLPAVRAHGARRNRRLLSAVSMARERRVALVAGAAAVSLALFAWLLSLHPAAAGRVYAAYGGVYIAVALLWLWQVDGVRPHLGRRTRNSCRDHLYEPAWVEVDERGPIHLGIQKGKEIEDARSADLMGKRNQRQSQISSSSE